MATVSIVATATAVPAALIVAVVRQPKTLFYAVVR